jgi:hypothetical protein
MAANNVYGDLTNTVGTLNGIFKDRYADKLENLIPDGVKALNMIKFGAKGKTLGNLYNQPVILGLEHGVTFADSDDDAFALNPPIAGQTKNAQVKGYPMLLRAVLGLSAASRAESAGDAAFESAINVVVENMLRSVTRKLETELFYGQMGYGTVAAAVGLVITVTTSEWAPGIWAGAETMPIEIRDVTGAISRGTTSITAVDMDARTLTVAALPPGTVATDVIYHMGAYGKEFAGIHKILTTVTGSLFGISTSSYAMWRGNQFSASAGPLSFNKLNLALARAVEKGLDSKAVAFINPRAWSNLLNDQAALRRYDSSYQASKAETGSKSLMFHAQNGDIEIVPSTFVKEGYSYVLDQDCWMRVGSTDVTFKRPGKEGDFFRELENSAGYELRAYTDQALFCSSPGRNVVITGIVNSVV